MQKATGGYYKRPHTIHHDAISQYTWEMRDPKTTTCIPAANNTNFSIDMISIDNMASSAMVISFLFFRLRQKRSY